MASLLMHLAISKRLVQDNYVSDNSYFYLGSVLPDAIEKDDQLHKTSHFTKYLEDGFKFIDFEEFYSRHYVEIKTSHLYYGYYMHLLEDAVYRSMLANEFGILKNRLNPDFKEKLYSDYHKINEYLTSKYEFDKVGFEDIVVPRKISKITTFNTDILVESVALQTNEVKQDQAYNYFNKDMVDTYIDKALCLVKKETVNIVENRKSLLKVSDFKY